MKNSIQDLSKWQLFPESIKIKIVSFKIVNVYYFQTQIIFMVQIIFTKVIISICE